MIYIIYTEWSSTKGNHAGMAYLAEQLGKANKNVKLYKIPVYEFYGGNYLILANILLSVFKIIYELKRGDKVFLMEYLEPNYSRQHIFAKAIRIFRNEISTIALSHLSGQHLLEKYQSRKNISKHLSLVDKVLVFGSSLKEFLDKEIGDSNKVIRTFHYVDDKYYKPKLKIPKSQKTRVLFMGSLKRDFKLLNDIVSKTPFVEFDILMGNNKFSDDFENLPNVTLYPFLSEDELLNVMQNADISLSPMRDTVGSNVIVTSMAVGLAMVVSDVGSIRDYLDDTNSFFCENLDDYVDSIKKLAFNKSTLSSMKKSSRKKAEQINLEKFNFWLLDYFEIL